MLLSLLGLLLAGAEPSSHGFLSGKSSVLDGDTPGYANHVVHHANDINNKTMHIHEVPPTCMELPAARKHDMSELTSPPHTAQRNLVHPRGPVNLRDVNQNTTGFDPLTNAICTSNEHNTNNSDLRVNTNHHMMAGRRPPADDHDREPLSFWWALHQVTAEYKYFVRKPPSPPK